mmetsp:Transcript_57528/g.136875  ORF Transcript_57528/g.136875 Transcript_57528/m.136875 type:complete len:221 (-) Transcript_57528:434-1096(-)
MPRLLEFGEDAIEHVELPAGSHDVLRTEVELVVEKVGVVAHLAKANDNVVERLALDVALVIARAERRVLQLPVHDALQPRERALDDHLAVLRHGELKILVVLRSPEHERPQHLVEAIDEDHLLLLANLLLLGILLDRERLREPRLEILVGIEDSREEEVEEVPEFVHVVLQRRPCQDHLALRNILLRQNHEKLGVLVLEAMALIDDDVRPRDGLEHSKVL